MRNVLVMLLVLAPAVLGGQCTSPPTPLSGTIGGAEYVIYLPQPASCFNGQMILFAHGYVQPGAPAGSWQSQLTLPDGTSLPGLLNSFGFGFAASGFSKDGLAILQGMQDMLALTSYVTTVQPSHDIYITGVSEGGLIAAKLAEQSTLYNGGIATCGPVGSFQNQINYFGDVRVLFDYFFPGVLSGASGSAIDIPPILMSDWGTFYEPAVLTALAANPLATAQLINTAGIEIGKFSNASDAITGALWYNVFATTDAQTTLGGNPYGNVGREYKGSLNDARLNAMVARFTASPTALANIAPYETTGLLNIPLVTLHTLYDPIVPYWQEPLYAQKVASVNKSPELTQIPVVAYGHCNFSVGDVETAIATLLLKVL